MTNSGQSHGKIILIGEHAVVYGQPAITVPLLNVLTTVEVTPSHNNQTYIDSNYYQGSLEEAPANFQGIVLLIELLMKDLPIDHALKLNIQSQLPLERGMGSSAATAAAITKALFAYANYSIKEDQLLQYTDFSEKIIHGTPSGVDAVTVNSTQPVYYIKNKLTQTFTMNLPGYLVIIDSGITGNTGQAVHDLRLLKQQDPAAIDPLIIHLGDLTKLAKQQIEARELTALGQTLNQAQKILKTLQLSTQFLDELIITAIQNGALGAKITGSGRGGCLIALSADLATAQSISQAAEMQGAARTWIQPLHQS